MRWSIESTKLENWTELWLSRGGGPEKRRNRVDAEKDSWGAADMEEEQERTNKTNKQKNLGTQIEMQKRSISIWVDSKRQTTNNNKKNIYLT